MAMVMSGMLVLLAPAPAHPEDGDPPDRDDYKQLTVILLISLGILALLVGLLIHESRQKKARSEGSNHQDQLGGSGYAQRTMRNEQDLVPPYLKDSNHQYEHHNHVSLANNQEKNFTFNSRNMVNLQEGWPIFNMDELLRSSAQPLYGHGVFGRAYKVPPTGLPTIMIRHLKDVSISYQEFQSRVGDLAKLNHVNVLPIVAYFFSENEKILLYEYLGFGSLSYHLHGKGIEGWIPLDWPKRAQIALDVARGIAYIHGKGRNKGLTHGNIKPSNVLLRGIGLTGKACLVDTGLSHLLRACPQSLNVGYRAPEVVTHTNRLLTHKADVYSFGVLLLELLTAKQPFLPNTTKVLDLPRLIHSAIKEEWTVEIFDSHIPSRVLYEEEMVLLLKLAMDCVCLVPGERPSMAKVVEMIKLIHEFEDIPGSTYSHFSERLDQDSV